MIRVLVVDDQQILIEGLTTLLNMDDGIQVVGQAKNGEEALLYLAGHPAPDIILMDIRMPKMNGVICTREVRRRYPEIRVLVLTTFDDDAYISEALSNGASGYLLKDLSLEKLTSAIRNVYAGNTVMDQIVTDRMVERMKAGDSNGQSEPQGAVVDLNGCRLHEREEQVLRLVARGYKNGEIAQELFLSEGTVKNYISVLYEKFGIKGRTKLMSYAIGQGILQEDRGKGR